MASLDSQLDSHII